MHLWTIYGPRYKTTTYVEQFLHLLQKKTSFIDCKYTILGHVNISNKTKFILGVRSRWLYQMIFVLIWLPLYNKNVRQETGAGFRIISGSEYNAKTIPFYSTISTIITPFGIKFFRLISTSVVQII